MSCNTPRRVRPASLVAILLFCLGAVGTTSHARPGDSTGTEDSEAAAEEGKKIIPEFTLYLVKQVRSCKPMLENSYSITDSIFSLAMPRDGDMTVQPGPGWKTPVEIAPPIGASEPALLVLSAVPKSLVGKGSGAASICILVRWGYESLEPWVRSSGQRREKGPKKACFPKDSAHKFCIPEDPAPREVALEGDRFLVPMTFKFPKGKSIKSLCCPKIPLQLQISFGETDEETVFLELPVKCKSQCK